MRTNNCTACPPYRVEGSGPALIYISGLDGTGELFFKQTTALAHSFRVITYRSRDLGKFTYEDLAGDVASIVRDMGEHRATVLGESFGGTVALNVALRYPDMVERLIIINSFARFRGRTSIRLATTLASAIPFRLLKPARLAANALGLYLDSVSGDDRQRFFKAVATVTREGYKRRLRLIADLDVENRLSEIQVPTLFIAGEKDRLLKSAREARAMAAGMHNAQVRVIPGAGHACLLGDRVRLDEILAEWSQ